MAGGSTIGKGYDQVGDDTAPGGSTGGPASVASTGVYSGVVTDATVVDSQYIKAYKICTVVIHVQITVSGAGTGSFALDTLPETPDNDVFIGVSVTYKYASAIGVSYPLGIGGVRIVVLPLGAAAGQEVTVVLTYKTAS